MDPEQKQQAIERAKEHFGKLVGEQLDRVEKLKAGEDWLDFSKIKPIIIGVAGGDGIGPTISKEAERVLAFLLADEVKKGKVELREITGLTIENRAKLNKSLPDDVLLQLKACHAILKGPTHTPRKGDPWPNIESANVSMRRELDLFANCRPVRVPEQGIDWMFFRENTEDLYAVGSKGINVTDDLAIDFKVITSQGTDRIIRLGFDYARKNGFPNVTIVTKANIIKTTDGKFLSMAAEVAKDFPGITYDDWYIDIMTAKLLDPERRAAFHVMVLPNLYGDIITDEAAQIQGGVGTGGSANIGKRYAMFEAIHGTALRMVEEGRVQYADPSSMVKAAAMLLNHIGYVDLARKLEMTLEICTQFERKVKLTGRADGATGAQLADYMMETVQRADLEEAWKRYQR